MKVKITKCPVMASGGSMYDAGGGLKVEGGQATPISDSMLMLGGKSHEEGGTDISYNGQQVEAEKGEPVSIGDKGEAIVWGNMNVPGTSKRFKTVAKDLGEKEEQYSKLDMKANDLLSNSDQANKWERPAWNSGRIMQIGALYGQKDVNDKKSQLADLQKALLQTAQEHNVDPQELSKGNIKKAKKGAFIPYKKILEAGDTVGGDDPTKPTRSDRNNNPGNIKYGKYAKSIDPNVKQDADGFAIFSDPTIGHTAMQNLLTGNTYKNLPVKDAITRWTGGKPYDLSGLGDLQGKKISDLNPQELGNVMDYMKQGEGTKYGTANPSTFAKNTPQAGGGYKNTPYNYVDVSLPNESLTPDSGQGAAPAGATPPPLPDVNAPNRPNIKSNAQSLDLKQILPELYGFAANKEIPVALQKYNPQLYVPYQMSFQDRKNDNQATFNEQSRQFGNNPALVSSLGAQKYARDNDISAEQFRTNQGIQAETINKNVATNNEAQLKNLQLADLQFTRQAEARSRTKEINQAILNSISSKYLENNLQSKTLKAYENLYDYRFNNNGQAQYEGPQAQFNYAGHDGENNGVSQYSRTITDNKGNVRVVTPSEQTIQGQQSLNQERNLNVMQKRRNFFKSFNQQ